jgi:hypothetical protein
MAETYERKISSEEAREGYVMVLKDRLNFFPAVGENFELVVAGKTRKVAIEAEYCECRGPEKPHEHYRIRMAGLVKGRKITFARAGETYAVTER